MNILAFDTSFFTCSVGLSHADKIDVVDRYAPMQQSKLVLPIIAELLQQANLTPDALDALAYGCGPGSFTGIRIAQSVAQGIGFAVQKPIIPISSMAILAQSAWLEHGWEKIFVCLDARMGKIYWAEFVLNQKNNILELQGAEHLCAIADLPKQNRSDWYGVGEGWKTYNMQLLDSTKIQVDAVDSTREPLAKAILLLANEIISTQSHDLR